MIMKFEEEHKKYISFLDDIRKILKWVFVPPNTYFQDIYSYSNIVKSPYVLGIWYKK